jgi:Na+/proline symporter
VSSGFDPELALPLLSQQLLPQVLVGVILAGLFAATMSTADSQILSCSAALTEDMQLLKGESVWKNKLATIIVTVVALIIALFGYKNVFQLVVLSAGSLASGFGPIVLVLAAGGKPSHTTMMAMMVGGIASMLIWHYAGLHAIAYEVMPGLLGGLLVFGAIRLFRKPASA